MSDNHVAMVICDLQKQLNEVRDSLQLQIDRLVVERDRSVCLLEEAGITDKGTVSVLEPQRPNPLPKPYPGYSVALEEGPGEAPVSCIELLKQRLLLSEEAAGIRAVAVFLLWLLGATCGALSYSFYGPFHKEEFDTLSVGAL